MSDEKEKNPNENKDTNKNDANNLKNNKLPKKFFGSPKLLFSKSEKNLLNDIQGNVLSKILCKCDNTLNEKEIEKINYKVNYFVNNDMSKFFTKALSFITLLFTDYETKSFAMATEMLNLGKLYGEYEAQKKAIDNLLISNEEKEALKEKMGVIETIKKSEASIQEYNKIFTEIKEKNKIEDILSKEIIEFIEKDIKVTEIFNKISDDCISFSDDLSQYIDACVSNTCIKYLINEKLNNITSECRKIFRYFKKINGWYGVVSNVKTYINMNSPEPFKRLEYCKEIDNYNSFNEFITKYNNYLDI